MAKSGAFPVDLLSERVLVHRPVKFYLRVDKSGQPTPKRNRRLYMWEGGGDRTRGQRDSHQPTSNGSTSPALHQGCAGEM